MSTLTKLTKLGMVVSLVLIAHALFYPNKYSLLIVIVGYILVIVSAVVYGLCKAPLKTSIEKVAEISKSPQSFNLKDVANTYQKLLIQTSPRIGMVHRVPSGFTFDMLDLERDKLEYLEQDKLVEWGVPKRRDYRLPTRKIDEISIYKLSGQVNKIKQENVNVPECQ